MRRGSAPISAAWTNVHFVAVAASAEAAFAQVAKQTPNAILLDVRLPGLDGLSALARWGLAARATNYLLVGVLVAALAFGSHHGETDQHGALQETANSAELRKGRDAR